MRAKLWEMLQGFVDGTVAPEELRSGCERLLRAGLRSHLSAEEKRPVLNFIEWWVEFYDPQLAPRQGVLGKLRDLRGQMKGEYRVDRQGLLAEARRVLAVLAE
jgi:hypothetical protein